MNMYKYLNVSTKHKHRNKALTNLHPPPPPPIYNNKKRIKKKKQTHPHLYTHTHTHARARTLTHTHTHTHTHMHTYTHTHTHTHLHTHTHTHAHTHIHTHTHPKAFIIKNLTGLGSRAEKRFWALRSAITLAPNPIPRPGTPLDTRGIGAGSSTFSSSSSFLSAIIPKMKVLVNMLSYFFSSSAKGVRVGS